MLFIRSSVGLRLSDSGLRLRLYNVLQVLLSFSSSLSSSLTSFYYLLFTLSLSIYGHSFSFPYFFFLLSVSTRVESLSASLVSMSLYTCVVLFSYDYNASLSSSNRLFPCERRREWKRQTAREKGGERETFTHVRIHNCMCTHVPVCKLIWLTMSIRIILYLVFLNLQFSNSFPI